MCPIKFRAWHEDNKQMFSAEEMGRDELTINPDGRGFVNVHSASTRLSEYLTHMVPMQFTGLHDKDGKEIYEGDILERTERPTASGGIDIVSWHEIGWSPWSGNNLLEGIGFVQEDYKVIGNIYQNPDLCEK